MSLERILELNRRFRSAVGDHAPRAVSGASLDAETFGRLLDSMLLARHLDVAAHQLRAKGHGHYTICSSGHEANVVLGQLTHPTDPSLLHYRSAALAVERARHVPDVDPVRDIVLSLVAGSEEPISGGRHKVFGNKRLGIIPSTSTIASHLPRAIGLAFGIERAPRLGLNAETPRDAIAVVSFGDASLNHSTALGAFNAASWTLHQNLTLPLLFVCEDNGLGISVRTPEGWAETRLASMPHLTYFVANGWDLPHAHQAAARAVEHCRRTRRAAILHLRCVRLLGHAGSDVDTSYRAPAEIEESMAKDPVLCAALAALDQGALAAQEILARDDRARERVELAAEQAISRPKLTTRTQVMRALARPVDNTVAERAAALAKDHPPSPITLAQGINLALGEALDGMQETLLFGEDVAKKGGVYGVTKGLLQKAGPLRVFNTLLDEQTILGLALGTANLGLIPIPEIQYLAYLHNAEDQLRGEAASMQFFSNLAYDNPMVIRIAGLAYQKGFGGHFHNDNSLAVLRDIPGIVVLVPARGDDALELYRTAFGLAREARRVVVVIEPIALYHTRDLYEPNDGAWVGAPTKLGAEFGRARVYHPEARDLSIVTYGNGVPMSLRAARRIEVALGAKTRVVDLRWLSPLPSDDVLEHAKACRRLLVVDECRKSGNVSEAIFSAITDAGVRVNARRVTAADSFIPLGDAANLVLVDEDEIFDAARSLLSEEPEA
jgi:2-oxoisovalerate dehydrogenase E1 component